MRRPMLIALMYLTLLCSGLALLALPTGGGASPDSGPALTACAGPEALVPGGDTAVCPENLDGTCVTEAQPCRFGRRRCVNVTDHHGHHRCQCLNLN